MNFEIASGSKYSSVIQNKLVLVNDTAEGFIPAKLNKQLNLLQHKNKDEINMYSCPVRFGELEIEDIKVKKFED